MKKLVVLFSLLFCLCARADSIITATVTITNTAGTANGETITVNGVLRTWTNSVTVTANQILTNNTIGGAASNLFLAYASVRAPSSDLFRLSTNAIQLKSYVGFPMAVTLSAGWGTVTLATNSTTGWTEVRVPIAVAGPIEKTNVESGLVDYFNDNSGTNAVSASSNPFTNFVNTSTAQTVAGNKRFTGQTILSNALQTIVGGNSTNLGIYGSPNISGTVGTLDSGTWTSPTFVNAVNTGDPIRSPGLGIASEQFGFGTLALSNYDAAFGNSAIASGSRSVALGSVAVSAGPSSSAVGYNAVANSQSGSAFGNGSLVDTDFSYSTAIGYNATATVTHQVRLGTSSEGVSIPGTLQVDGSISNATFAGSVTLNNSLIFPRKNISGLVNGLNTSVDTSSNHFIKISGPSAAYSISGFNGGVNGREVIIQKNDSWVLTLLNDSGSEPGLSSTNRLYTGTGADVTVTNNPGFIRLIYDSTTSHWGVESKSN